MFAALFRLIRTLLVALLGAALAAKLLLRSHAAEETQEIDLVAIFASVDLASSAHPFFGGKVTTVLGGTWIDLRRVIPAPTGIYLDVLVVLGGVRVLVPPGWRVIFDGTLFAGGYDDLSRPVTDPDAPAVRIGGLVALGGLRAITGPPLEPTTQND